MLLSIAGFFSICGETLIKIVSTVVEVLSITGNIVSNVVRTVNCDSLVFLRDVANIVSWISSQIQLFSIKIVDFFSSIVLVISITCEIPYVCLRFILVPVRDILYFFGNFGILAGQGVSQLLKQATFCFHEITRLSRTTLESVNQEISNHFGICLLGLINVILFGYLSYWLWCRLIRNCYTHKRSAIIQIKKPEINLQCVICCDSVKCIVFMPCNHLSCCESCFNTLCTNSLFPRCPMCRIHITRSIKVFV